MRLLSFDLAGRVLIGLDLVGSGRLRAEVWREDERLWPGELVWIELIGFYLERLGFVVWLVEWVLDLRFVSMIFYLMSFPFLFMDKV